MMKAPDTIKISIDNLCDGELIPFIEALEFSSKAELIIKLNTIIASTNTLDNLSRLIVTQMVSCCLEQLQFCSEEQLMAAKLYLSTYARRKT